jgi:hypothetical protein
MENTRMNVSNKPAFLQPDICGFRSSETVTSVIQTVTNSRYPPEQPAPPSKKDGPRAGDARRRSRRFQGAANSVCTAPPAHMQRLSVDQPLLRRSQVAHEHTVPNGPRATVLQRGAWSSLLTGRRPPVPAIRRSISLRCSVGAAASLPTCCSRLARLKVSAAAGGDD